MVVTIDSKFYSKLQLGISKYPEKTPADPLNSLHSQVMCVNFWAVKQLEDLYHARERE